MSRRSGRNAALFIDDSSNACKNISGDVTSLTFNGLKNRPETTNMGVDDIRRELDGVRDATFDISAIYSHGTGACIAEMLQNIHIGTAYKRVQYFPEYQSSNSAYMTASAFLNNFSVNSPVDGIATMSATFELASNKILTPDVYAHKVLETSSGDLLAYWPMWDVSGSSNDNYETTATRDGSASNVLFGQTGIGDGRTSACFDGTLAFTNIYTSSLCSVFNGAEGTISAWAKVGSGVWTDGTDKVMLALSADADNRVWIEKDATSNQLLFRYRAGGTADDVTKSSVSDTGWVHWAMTWSKSGEKVIGYYKGDAVGSSATLGTWAGDLAATLCAIGALDKNAGNAWDGQIAHVAIWDAALSAAQIKYLASI